MAYWCLFVRSVWSCQYLPNFLMNTCTSWGSGSSPAKTGIEHYSTSIILNKTGQVLTLTCSTSSKSQAANLLSSETFLWKHQMVSWPKVGTWWNLHHVQDKSPIANNSSHRWSRSANTDPLRLPSMQSKWIKMDFQTPSSNSCSKSTTSIRKKSKLAEPSLDEKAFCNCNKTFLILH